MKDPRSTGATATAATRVVVAFDSTNDVAVLRVAGLGAPPLAARRTPVEGQSVAILGYPENGPFTATPGRIGQTTRRAHRRRLRARPGRAHDHDAARARPARQLGRAGGRHPRPRADDGLRRRASASTAATACRPTSSGATLARRSAAPVSTGPCARLEHVEDPERPPERRHDVDARRLLARLLDQLARELEADLGRVRRRRARSALLHRLRARRSRAPRCGGAARAGRLGSGQTPTSSGIGERPPKCARNASRYVEVEEDLRHRELRARLELALEALELERRGRRRSG